MGKSQTTRRECSSLGLVPSDCLTGVVILDSPHLSLSQSPHPYALAWSPSAASMLLLWGMGRRVDELWHYRLIGQLNLSSKLALRTYDELWHVEDWVVMTGAFLALGMSLSHETMLLRSLLTLG